MFSKVTSSVYHGFVPNCVRSSHRFFCSVAKTRIESVSETFHDKTALITGSTSGIGLCVAESLAAQGCKGVVITGFGDAEGALKKVKASALDSNRDSIHFVDADLSSKDESLHLVDRSIEAMKSDSIDIIVNNAGFQHVCAIESFPDDTYLKMIDVMLNSPFFITKAVIPYMRKNGYGRIINIASAHGLRSSAFKSAYCVAKHGLVGLTKATALEMALENHVNWTCNAICPGYVRTELATNQVHKNSQKSGKTYEEEEYKLLSEKNATAQWVEPENIASMVKFLCSDDARQITGSSLSIDGAWTAR